MGIVFSDGILLFCTSNLYVIDGYCKDPKGTDIIEVEEKANNEWVVDGVVAPVSHYFLPSLYVSFPSFLFDYYLFSILTLCYSLDEFHTTAASGHLRTFARY